MTSKPPTKRKKVDPAMLPDEPLILICEWEVCRQLFQDMEQFLSHVSEHAGEVGVSTKDSEVTVTCAWEDCGFETENQKEMLRHIYYHAYHTKIKCFGANLIEKLALQGCQLDPHTRNAVPELSEPLTCLWDACATEFLNVQLFYWHVHSHSNATAEKKDIKCLWDGCQSTLGNKFKLRDHFKKHTQERPIACPTCGSLFASRTKLHDHCLRQLPLDANEFRCSECSKLLPTERMLRDHMRYHRSEHFCPHCPKDKDGVGRSFSNAHALASHVAYCHSQLRPFPCPEPSCTYAAKTQADLSKHMDTHNTLWYGCEVTGCKFMARTTATLQRHVRKVHQAITESIYECHACQSQFRCSRTLKKHLDHVHQIYPTAGDGRFKYQQGEDGIFRAENGHPLPQSNLDSS